MGIMKKNVNKKQKNKTITTLF